VAECEYDVFQLEYKADPSDVTPKGWIWLKRSSVRWPRSFSQRNSSIPTVKSQQALVAQGVAGQSVTRPEKPSHKAAIVDIAKALQKSLAALKKTAAEQAARKDAKAAGTQGKKKIG
jgi:hypothetical protein